MKKYILSILLLILMPMTINAQVINLSIDKIGSKVVVNGTSPGPTLHFTNGETVVIHVKNLSKETSSIHWHGVILPTDMDGVPNLSFDGIAPDATFTYKFKVDQPAGTYWYHGHSGFQEHSGLFGGIIITDPEYKSPWDKEEVLILSDWADTPPLEAFKNLKANPEYYKTKRQNLLELLKSNDPLNEFQERLKFAKMRMDPTDVTDILVDNILVNGTLNPHIQFNKNTLYRVVNASAANYIDLKLQSGKMMKILSSDGNSIKPFKTKSLPMAIAETYDFTIESDDILLLNSRDGRLQSHIQIGKKHYKGFSNKTPPALKIKDVMHMDNMKMSPRNMKTMHMSMKPKLRDFYDRIEDANAFTPWIADRDVLVRLTGDMNRYIWSIDDRPYQSGDNIPLKFGEVVKLTFKNETMMNHPMHLHGMWFRVIQSDGTQSSKKHTVDVPPKKSVSVLVNVDARGRWAMHCHILYHLAAGMFREVRVK